MSALAVLSEWGREPPAGDFAAVFAALDQHGHDGRDVVRFRGTILGHQHFWTTPEEEGERQPFVDPASGVVLALDGRIDNRDQLAGQLGIVPPELARLSDAALVLRAWERWGEGCFQRLLGPFALVMLDTLERRLLCARDPLGDRTLCYYARPGLLVAASEASAVLCHPAVSSDLDQTTVARFFAFEAPLEGATYFADVRELGPAQLLVADHQGVQLRRYWQMEESRPTPARSIDDQVEGFRQVLAESVRCRLRVRGRPQVLMSGGLDSTTVAALAAHELRVTRPGTRMRTLSWVFADIAEADERTYIGAMVEGLDLEAVLIPGDDGWPSVHGDASSLDPNLPARDVFHRLMERAYFEVRAGHGRTLLTGHFGDQLYTAWPFWLRDLFKAGRPLEALRSVLKELDGRPLQNLIRPGPLRTAVAAALGRHGRQRTPAWLTEEARALVAHGTPGSARQYGGPRRKAPRTPLDPLWAHAASLQGAAAARQGVDVRFPYRDRRVVEAILAMDGHLLHQPGSSKWILRAAGRGLLPDSVRERTWVSTMAPLFTRGVGDGECPEVENVLRNKTAAWRRYVRPDWVNGRSAASLAAGGREAVVLWNCLCLEQWRQPCPKRSLDMHIPVHVGSDRGREIPR